MKLLSNIRKRNFYASKWLVFAIDLVILLNAFFISYIIRFNFTLNFERTDFKYQIPLIIIVGSISFLMIGSYKGIIRHTGIQDAYKVFYAAFIFSVLMTLVVGINRTYHILPFTIPLSIIAIHFMLNVIFLIGSRFLFKQIYHRLVLNVPIKKRVMIYGAGASGLITYMALSNDANTAYDVKGFIDDKKEYSGKVLKGIPIYLGKKINQKIIDEKGIDEIIISIQNIPATQLLKIIERLLPFGVKVKHVPPVSNWINGTLHSKQIKEVNLDELLQRAPIKLFQENIAQKMEGKVVLVTGAAGSIGSEICRQLAQYNCKQLLFLDQAESALYELQMNMKQVAFKNIVYLIADVSNDPRMQQIFEQYAIDCIFHAAAYKHVPLMEDNPYEGIRVNIKGSKTIMDLAVMHGVESFVMISTDKAVNPTNVMGATKRMAELYAQSKNKEGKTKFITTRFGNVLGSNGSVIPLFKKQIAQGGPLTVTHKDIIRYFMTIPEACQLVLEAAKMGNGGEIFVFDMGESVKIYDVAKNMIQLAGYRFPEEMDIEIIGLRPGEKLYEELLSNSETTLPTHHEKIMIAHETKTDFQLLHQTLNQIIDTKPEDYLTMIQLIKNVLPEYISNNSQFELLDKKTQHIN